MYFLGFVTKQNMLKGNIEPELVVCKNRIPDINRFNMYFRKATELNRFDTLILFTQLHDNKQVLDYFSDSQVYENKQYKEGGLFFFECDKHGRREGAALFVRKVPVKESMKYEGVTLSQILSGDTSMMNLWQSAQPLYFVQSDGYERNLRTKELQGNGFTPRKEPDPDLPDNEY